MILKKEDFEPISEGGNVYEEIQPGRYVVRLTAEASKPTKKGDGEYLELTWTIESGANVGRKLIDRLNLRNPSQKAVEIARRTLQQICEAANHQRPHDTADLLGCRVEVETFLEDYNGKSYARIKGYAEAPEAAATADDELPF